jgi:phosphate transport system substrate-binding protein
LNDKSNDVIAITRMMIKRYVINIIAVLSIGLLLPVHSACQNMLRGRLSLSGAFALYPMAVKWADEFRKINPGVKIDVSAGGAGKGITDVLNNMVDVGMVSRDIYPEEMKRGAFPFAVTKDAVVPVISNLNPFVNVLLMKGLTREAAINIWITGKNKTWNQAFNTTLKAPLHVYTRSDACGAAEVWAKFLGKMQEDLLGSAVFGDPGLALAVKKDPLGIGYNNIGYTYDFKTKKQLPGIKVLPLDLNNNGKIDPDENFYDSMDNLIEAIAKGKYPSPPTRDLYFVVHQEPKNKVLIEFLKWVLTDGQKYVNETGYINLSKDILEGELKKIN